MILHVFVMGLIMTMHINPFSPLGLPVTMMGITEKAGGQ